MCFSCGDCLSYFLSRLSCLKCIYDYYMYEQRFLQTITDVSEIRSRSKDRIGCGFSIPVLTRCTGGKDKLFMDNIRMTIQSADTTLHLIFPIAVSIKNLKCCCQWCTILNPSCTIYSWASKCLSLRA